MRIEGAIGIAALIALIDILPVLGTGGVMIPWSIIELVKGEFALGIGLAVLYLIVTVIRNILEPKMVGKQIGVASIDYVDCHVCRRKGIRDYWIIYLSHGRHWVKISI